MYYYITNLQGDVIAIADQGVVVVEYKYDAWGKLLSITGSEAQMMGRLNPLRYRGYVYDQETGLYYLQSRYYNPEWGRFINADALVSTGGLLGNNMYSYCWNNPVRYYDDLGRAPVETNLSDNAIDDLMDQNECGGPVGNPSIPVGQTSGVGGSNSSFSLFSTDAVTNGQTGLGKAPPQGPAGTVYTQLSSDGNNTIVSQTLYNEYNMPDLRIDYGGHSHGKISGVHIHFYSVYIGPNGTFLNKGPILKCLI